jgi:molybdate transport system substrate-binding protein
MAGFRAALLAAALLLAAGAARAELKVLSAGAVEPGLRAAADEFHRQGGEGVALTFATPATIRKRVGDGEAADVVIAPPWVLGELQKEGRLAAGAPVPLGRVGVGVIVRDGAPPPDISTPEALKRAVLAAEGLVFNVASTGTYVEGLLKRLGVWDEVAARTKRPADGARVMEQVSAGSGNEIGFGALTEIALYRGKGVRLVGPLPAELQNYTSYGAAATSPSEAGRAFLRHLGSAGTKALFAANGIE